MVRESDNGARGAAAEITRVVGEDNMKMRKYRRQEPPHSISIELTEGCNLRCSFCGLNGIREPKKNDFKFMEISTIERIVSQVAEARWTCRVGFAMRGEPTMHPNFIGMIGT